MQIINKGVIDDFKSKYADARAQADSWVAEVEAAEWILPQDIKRRYVAASFLKDNQVVFDIKGNKYRLLTKINYKNGIVLLKKAGAHKEYIKW